MTDIFDATIFCKTCKKEMIPIVINKQGGEMRAVECIKCKDTIIHPTDLNTLEQYNNLRRKTYNVKLRIVGNSHTISIPKEIVKFIQEQEKIMDGMVRLAFEDMHRLSLNFRNHKEEIEDGR